MMDRKNLLTSSFIALGLGAAGALSAAPASADQVFADDVIVQGSLCVGFDCVNNEVFGDTTILMKENNTRVKFLDTSVGSFPSTDWQLTANDSANGGANRFSIEDVTDGKTPFTITGNAPSNSIFVDSGGRVGLKTATPSVELHLRDGDSPTIRLEQDGSSGFAPQTWDLAGNETNFFVRDVTGGSRLPFRIKPGAPTDAIFVAANGNIGMGAGTTPGAPLHVKRTDASGRILVEDTSATFGVQLELKKNGTPRIRFDNSASNAANSEWDIGLNATDDFIVRTFQGAANAVTVTSAGNMTLTGTLTTSGSCSVGCDRVFDADYDLPSIDQHTQAMWENGYLPAVGPTPENGPMNVSDKMGRMLNELEKAHIYIEQLHGRLAHLETIVSSDDKKMK